MGQLFTACISETIDTSEASNILIPSKIISEEENEESNNNKKKQKVTKMEEFNKYLLKNKEISTSNVLLEKPGPFLIRLVNRHKTSNTKKKEESLLEDLKAKQILNQFTLKTDFLLNPVFQNQTHLVYYANVKSEKGNSKKGCIKFDLQDSKHSSRSNTSFKKRKPRRSSSRKSIKYREDNYPHHRSSRTSEEKIRKQNKGLLKSSSKHRRKQKNVEESHRKSKRNKEENEHRNSRRSQESLCPLFSRYSLEKGCKKPKKCKAMVENEPELLKVNEEKMYASSVKKRHNPKNLKTPELCKKMKNTDCYCSEEYEDKKRKKNRSLNKRKSRHRNYFPDDENIARKHSKQSLQSKPSRRFEKTPKISKSKPKEEKRKEPAKEWFWSRKSKKLSEENKPSRSKKQIDEPEEDEDEISGSSFFSEFSDESSPTPEENEEDNFSDDDDYSLERELSTSPCIANKLIDNDDLYCLNNQLIQTLISGEIKPLGRLRNERTQTICSGDSITVILNKTNQETQTCTTPCENEEFPSSCEETLFDTFIKNQSQNLTVYCDCGTTMNTHFTNCAVQTIDCPENVENTCGEFHIPHLHLKRNATNDCENINRSTKHFKDFISCGMSSLCNEKNLKPCRKSTESLKCRNCAYFNNQISKCVEFEDEPHIIKECSYPFQKKSVCSPELIKTCKSTSTSVHNEDELPYCSLKRLNDCNCCKSQSNFQRSPCFIKSSSKPHVCTCCSKPLNSSKSTCDCDDDKFSPKSTNSISTSIDFEDYPNFSFSKDLNNSISNRVLKSKKCFCMDKNSVSTSVNFDSTCNKKAVTCNPSKYSCKNCSLKGTPACICNKQEPNCSKNQFNNLNSSCLFLKSNKSQTENEDFEDNYCDKLLNIKKETQNCNKLNKSTKYSCKNCSLKGTSACICNKKEANCSRNEDFEDCDSKEKIVRCLDPKKNVSNCSKNLTPCLKKSNKSINKCVAFANSTQNKSNCMQNESFKRFQAFLDSSKFLNPDERENLFNNKVCFLKDGQPIMFGGCIENTLVSFPENCNSKQYVNNKNKSVKKSTSFQWSKLSIKSLICGSIKSSNSETSYEEQMPPILTNSFTSCENLITCSNLKECLKSLESANRPNKTPPQKCFSQICNKKDSYTYSDFDDSGYDTEKQSEVYFPPELGKYYYKKNEVNCLYQLKQIMKMKSIRKNDRNDILKYIPLLKEIEKFPNHDCRVRVEVYSKHDDLKCPGQHYGYIHMGSLEYPICSLDIIPQKKDRMQKSMKSYRLNEPDAFKISGVVNRKYAYPYKVLSKLKRDCICDDTDDNISNIEICSNTKVRCKFRSISHRFKF